MLMFSSGDPWQQAVYRVSRRECVQRGRRLGTPIIKFHPFAEFDHEMTGFSQKEHPKNAEGDGEPHRCPH